MKSCLPDLKAARQRKGLPIFVAAMMLGVRVDVLKSLECFCPQRAGLHQESLVEVVKFYTALLGVAQDGWVTYVQSKVSNDTKKNFSTASLLKTQKKNIRRTAPNLLLVLCCLFLIVGLNKISVQLKPKQFWEQATNELAPNSAKNTSHLQQDTHACVMPVPFFF